MLYKKCLDCNHHFRLRKFQVDAANKTKISIQCPNCTSKMITRSLRVEWAKYNGMMDKALWDEYRKRNLPEQKHFLDDGKLKGSEKNE